MDTDPCEYGILSGHQILAAVLDILQLYFQSLWVIGIIGRSARFP